MPRGFVGRVLGTEEKRLRGARERPFSSDHLRHGTISVLRPDWITSNFIANAPRSISLDAAGPRLRLEIHPKAGSSVLLSFFARGILFGGRCPQERVGVRFRTPARLREARRQRISEARRHIPAEQAPP